MKSLQKSGYALRAVIALMIIGTCVLSAAAQRVEPQSQGRMYGEPGFRGEPINLNVVNADIRDILNYITEQYGINFVLDKSVKSVPVTVNVTEVPWNVALASILKSQDLDVQVNGQILRVAERSTLAADEEVDRKIRESQLNASPLMTKYVRLNYARAKTSLLKGASSAGMRSDPTLIGGGVQEVVAASGGSGGSNEGLLPIIQRRLSKRGSIEVDGRSNALIITDVRENIDRIMDLIAILDQPEPQVEIETRIVVATRNFSRDLGTQLSASVLSSRGRGVALGTDLTAQNPLNTLLNLTTGVFGTAQIDLAISAGERKGQAKIIASPRVTVLNNEQATIQSGTKIPIQTIQPTQGGGGTAIVTTEYVEVPLKLQITPQITDVGTVVLQVLAENASTAITVTGVPPAINNQKMDTQVTVPDGGTTVVGGVLFDDERESQDRTPGLSKIPIFGNLFRRKGVQRDTNEILFFITPRIQKPDFGNAVGTAGVRTEGTFVQPVPLGNPNSNSETPAADMTRPAVLTGQPLQPSAPTKP